MFYPQTTAEIKRRLRVAHPHVKAVFRDIDTIQDSSCDIAEYLYWMLSELQTFQSSDPAKDMRKRASWMGYVIGRMEAMGLITNALSRELVRNDKDANLL